MSGHWTEVIRLAFKGERFRDHALNLAAITELGAFQSLVSDAAKALWRQKNPDRRRLPAHFEERVTLCLRTIEEGSAVAPLEVYVRDEDPAQQQFIPTEPVEAQQAVELVRDVYAASEADRTLPNGVTRDLLPGFAKWGQSLRADEEIEMRLPKSPPARTKPSIRERLRALMMTPYTDQVKITGEVLAVDLRRSRFQLWPNDSSSVEVAFTDNQEAEVTDALKNHKARCVRVSGMGEYSPEGRLLRINPIGEMRILPIQGDLFDRSARPIWDELAELAAQVPDEEWEKLPDDLTSNLDHYIYGVAGR